MLGIQETRLRTYIRPYLYAMGIFQYNNVLHSTEREKLNMKTGVRTTQHRMEKVRRELHLPARHMYQVVLTYWMYLQSVTLSPSIQNGEAQSNVLQRQYLKNHIGFFKIQRLFIVRLLFYWGTQQTDRTT
jgi:hypothetical protein